MSTPNPELRKIMLFSARPKQNVLLSDLIKYESVSGDSLGKDIQLEIGEGTPGILIEPLENMYHEVSVPADITNESIREYLKNVSLVAITEIKSGSTDKTKDLFLSLEKAFTISNEITQRLAISFLEDIQTAYINMDIEEDKILPFLLPKTLVWWNEIQRFWDSASEWVNEYPESNPKRESLLEGIKGYL